MSALSSWLPLLGAALVGGVIGGATMRLLPPRPAATAPYASAVARAEDARAADPERIERLEQRIGALERRRKASDALAAYGQALAADQGKGGAADGGAPIAPENPGFELAVRGVLERVDEERQQERISERNERQQRRVTELVTSMASELGLSADQRTRVEQVLRDHYEELGKLRGPGAERGGDRGAERGATDRPVNREQRRERMQALNAQTDAKLGTILDGKQLSQFRERRDEMLGTGFRRRPAD